MKYISHLPLPLIFALMIVAGASLNWHGKTTAQDQGRSGADVSSSEAQPTAAQSGKKTTAGKILSSPFRLLGRLFNFRRSGNEAAVSGSVAARRNEIPFESAAVARVASDAAQATSESAVAEALQKTAREQLKRSRQLIAQGNYREATTLLTRAASLDPSLIEARILLATIFDLQGMSERAAYYYKDVIDRRQHINDREAALALNNRGYSLYLAGAYKEAKKLISQAVELDSTNARFLNNLGAVNYRLHKHKDAVQAFAKAGGELQGHVNVAILFEQDGRFPEAVKYYERARRLNPSSELVLQRLQILHDRGAPQIAKSEISSGYLIPGGTKR